MDKSTAVMAGAVSAAAAGWAGVLTGLGALADELPGWVITVAVLGPVLLAGYLAISWDLRQWIRPGPAPGPAGGGEAHRPPPPIHPRRRGTR